MLLGSVKPCFPNTDTLEQPMSKAGTSVLSFHCVLRVPHPAEFIKHAHVLIVLFALEDEFSVILPPVEQGTLFHPAFVGQMVVLLYVSLELAVFVEPYLFSFSCCHNLPVKIACGPPEAFLWQPTRMSPYLYHITSRGSLATPPASLNDTSATHTMASEVEAHAQFQTHLGALAEAVETEVAIDRRLHAQVLVDVEAVAHLGCEVHVVAIAIMAQDCLAHKCAPIGECALHAVHSLARGHIAGMLVHQAQSQEDAVLLDVIPSAYPYLQVIAVLHLATRPLVLIPQAPIYHPAVLHEIAPCGLYAHLELGVLAVGQPHARERGVEV